MREEECPRPGLQNDASKVNFFGSSHGRLKNIEVRNGGTNTSSEHDAETHVNHISSTNSPSRKALGMVSGRT